MYEIVYDYDDGWAEHRDNVETFEGSWHELQAHIKQMRQNGCYNIYATSVKE